MEVTLVVTEGSARGRAIPLPATVFTIGRAPRCHLRPHSRSVSKFHCAIARWAGKVAVRDLRSANGTFVNGRRVEGEVCIQDGDTLAVGPLRFVFRIRIDPDGVLPIQVVHQGDLNWLMESPDVPPDRTASETHCAPASELLPPAADSGRLSAGTYLRDYLDQHKN
jgi:pSer/pThr/pTyr-binding forkhead associated (FHA) protein